MTLRPAPCYVRGRTGRRRYVGMKRRYDPRYRGYRITLYAIFIAALAFLTIAMIVSIVRSISAMPG